MILFLALISFIWIGYIFLIKRVLSSVYLVLVFSLLPVGAYIFLGEGQNMPGWFHQERQMLIKTHALLRPILHDLKKETAKVRLALEDSENANNAQLWMKLGELYYLQKDYERAIDPFVQALKTESLNPQDKKNCEQRLKYILSVCK